MLVALVARLVDLDVRPLHHDESLHAFYGLEFQQHLTYRYIPFLHGPVLYYLTALGFALFGVSDFVARLFPVLAGTMLCFYPWFFRHQLGRYGALCAAWLIALSPTYLYYSRFLRHDIYSEVFHVTALLGFLKFQQSKKQGWIVVAIAALTLNYANHELNFITCFLIAVYGLVILIKQKQWADLGHFLKAHREKLLWGLTVAFVIYTLFFTTFFRNPWGFLHGLPNPFSTKTSLGYWLSQHEVKRGGQPIYYYALLLLAYEFFCIALVPFCKRYITSIRNSQFLAFLIYFAAGSFIIYSWAGERMPWLLMHPLLPILLIAGFVVGKLIEEKRIVALCMLMPIFLFQCFISGRLNYQSAADPRELLVFTQTSPDVKDVVATMNTLRNSQNRKINIAIDEELSWPFPWYMRDSAITAYTKNLRQVPPANYKDKDILLVHTRHENEKLKMPYPFVQDSCHALRHWWVPPKGEYEPWTSQGLKNLTSWWLHRKPPSGYGKMTFCLYKNATSINS